MRADADMSLTDEVRRDRGRRVETISASSWVGEIWGFLESVR